jgi:MFS family permease
MTAPVALVTALTSPLSGRIVGRRGPRLPLVIAGSCLLVACALLAGVDAQTPIAHLVVAYVVLGLGVGFVNAPVTNTAVSGMPRAQAGVAAAVATTSRQVGQTLGVAVAGAILASHTGAGLTTASRPGWWTLAACGGVILALGVMASSRRARRSARRTAAELNPEALVA